jgi:hypothetical protein
MLKLVEELSGRGELRSKAESFGEVGYRIARYQGMLDSGLPVPGLHRIEGHVDMGPSVDAAALVGALLTIRLEDGRALGITLADADGRVLSEGHGPMRCLCC